MNRFLLVFLLLFCVQIQAQNIPEIGKNGQLEIGNWNIEWYGHKSNGPANEYLQQKNVIATLKASKADVWALCEVSDATAWDSMLLLLPEYNGVISSWSQTQKTALIYKKELFTLLYSRHILQSKSADFAGGRLPLEVALLFKNNLKTDTLYFEVIHLKANVGTWSEKQAAYQLRLNSSKHLKGYLDTFQRGKKLMVLGDWNDDLDSGILDSTATPFRNFLQDSAHYFFTTRKLSQQNVGSTASFNNMIDQQCISPALKKYFVHDSCKVWKLNNFIANYSNTTSDHYPVFSLYNVNLTHAQFPVLPNAGKRLVYFDGVKLVPVASLRYESFEVFTITGRKVFSGAEIRSFVPENNQFYFVHCLSDASHSIQKIFIP